MGGPGVQRPPRTVISLILRVFSLIHFSLRTFSVALMTSLSFLISCQQGHRGSPWRTPSRAHARRHSHTVQTGMEGRRTEGVPVTEFALPPPTMPIGITL